MQIKYFLVSALLLLTLQSALAQIELIQNGGFEASTTSIAPWQASNSGNAPQNVLSSIGAYAGSQCLRLASFASGDGNSYSQDIYQTVTFPTNMIQATLSFEINIPTTDPNTLSSDTILTVEITDQSQNVLAYTQASNLTSTTNYYLYTSTFVTNAGTPYVGETVNVHFIANADGVLGAYTPFYIDNVSLQVATTANIPANDNFTNASVISGSSATIFANNSFASKEPGEPNFDGYVGGHSLWWTWTAPSNGLVAITTSSAIQTLVGVYTGSQVSSLTQVAASPTQVSFKATAGTQYAIGVDGYVGAVGAITLGFSFVLDKTLPTVAILTPAPGASVTNPFVVVSGIASDNLAVAQVQYRLENSTGTNAYQTATGTNSWSATVTGLIPGPNTVRVRSVDTSGNISATVARTYSYIIVSPLALNISGRGTVSGATNGQLLAIGNTYHLTASPAIGFGFGGWSGDINTNPASLTFVMQTNLYLQANFVDITKPTVTITNPVAAGAHWSNATFTIAGKASDNVAVTNVYLNFNHGGWSQADSTNGYTNWNTVVTLTPGTNTVSAYAVDSSGNLSTTNTVSWVYILSAPLTVSTNGRGTVSPNENNALLQLGARYTLTATAATGFAFTNWTDGFGNVVTNRATLIFTMASNLVFVAEFVDVTKPTVAITNLAAGGGVSNAFFTVRGKAADNVGVVNVFYNLNNGGYQGVNPAGYVTNWSAGLALTPGTNTLAAYATDGAGNVSLTNTVKFVYVLSAPLTVSTNGKGSIAPNDNNALLQLGKSYTLTATPAAGFAFTNWTDGFGNVVTNRAALTFLMASNLAFTANFVDVARPTVTVTAPAALTGATNEFYVANGKAADNAGVAGVMYAVNGGGWYAASGTTNWSVTLDLPPGTNALAVYAVDTSGNHSLTNTTKFLYPTAPTTLNGLKATVTPDGATSFNVAFGVATFSQQSADTNNVNGVGSYTYTKLTPTSGKLKITYTAPPAATGGGADTINLTFNPPGVARFTNNADTGGIIFTSTPTLVPASFLNQTVVAVQASGDGSTIHFSAGQGYEVDLTDLATNKLNYTYATYSPVGALLKQTHTNNSVTYTVVTFGGTNYGTAYSESYDNNGNMSDTTLADFALASQRAGGNAPTNTVNRSAVVTTTGSADQLNFADSVNFVDVNPADSSVVNGSGTYGYSRTGTNTSSLNLNYFIGAGAPSSLPLLFVAPNFAIFTNVDTTLGTFILK